VHSLYSLTPPVHAEPAPVRLPLGLPLCLRPSLAFLDRRASTRPVSPQDPLDGLSLYTLKCTCLLATSARHAGPLGSGPPLIDLVPPLRCSASLLLLVVSLLFLTLLIISSFSPRPFRFSSLYKHGHDEVGHLFCLVQGSDTSLGAGHIAAKSAVVRGALLSRSYVYKSPLQYITFC
jgi:hypothetical protein